MKIIFKGKTLRADRSLKNWAKHNKESKLISENPVTLLEEYKDSSITYMLKGMSKRLGISQDKITSNEVYKNTVKGKLLRKASQNLKVPSKELTVEVINDE